MAPDDASTIENVVADIGMRPQGATLLVVGYFKTNLATPEGRDRDEVIAAALADECLEEMSDHFLPRHKPWLKDGRTWAMHRGGREVLSQTDYIMGTDSCLFQNVAVWDMQQNIDHYLVLWCL